METMGFALSGGDIAIEGGGIKMIQGREVWTQAFRQILATRLGEYTLNPAEGLDFGAFLGKREIDEDEANAALQAAASQLAPFVRFAELGYEHDREARALRVGFRALFEDGSSELISEAVGLDG